MFWYQCRYCKVNFEQWEKLVTHRRDEHTQEFEALKRRSALLLRRQEEATAAKKENPSSHSENRCCTDAFPVQPLPLLITTNKMKPTTSTASVSSISSTASTFTTPPRRSHKSSASKELDAKDLENQEISLRIPSSSVGVRCSTPYDRDSSPPHLFPTPASSPRQNGNNSTTSSSSALRHSSKIEYNGSNGHHHPPTLTSSFLTPPVTPSRLPPSPLHSAEEMVLNMNMNWSLPISSKRAVQYHEMSDEDEIEIALLPGSQFTVTRNFFPRANSPPIEDDYRTDYRRIQSFQHLRLQRQQEQKLKKKQHQHRSGSSHVMIENIEDELQMSCSSNNGVNGDTAGDGSASSSNKLASDKSGETSANNDVGVVRQSAHLDMLRSTGQRLQRLHSKLEQQNKEQRARMNFIPLPSPAATTTTTPNSNGDDHANGCKRSRINTNKHQGSDDDNANTTNRKRRGCGVDIPANSTTATVNTSRSSPLVLRLNTRASPRRPKKLI